MRIFYNMAIYFYQALVILASLVYPKATLWHRGRKDFFGQWKDFSAGGRKVIWMHCASLGEFEQGRPVIEEIKKRDEHIFILLSFFSPSGFEIRKEYPHADAVCYLPADTVKNARKFIETFRPEMAIFVKYEFWYNYIVSLKRNQIPIYLISANFRQNQIFFKWYGRWFGNMLHMFSHIFVQGNDSLRLLNSIGITRVSVAGDTRFDRVFTLALARREVPVADDFSGREFTIVAGSTWAADHRILIRFINETNIRLKMIIAPHEIDENEIRKLERRISATTVRYSIAERDGHGDASVMIIDNIGMLSSLYAYGNIAYVGGGFGKGIHNILEACTHGLPVIFGPNYNKFREAKELVEQGGAFPVSNYRDFHFRAETLITNPDFLNKAGGTARKYVYDGTGACYIIVNHMFRVTDATP
jgi:3-deoxy-D-manno-octulosonic-acid transferase